MGIITKTVKLYPRGTAIAYYKEKGYDAKYGQELEVKVEDLQLCSTALVDTICDYCGKPKEPQKCVTYNAQTKNGTEKCCCINCAPLKRNEVMLEKYDYEYAFQVPELKKKIQETNMQRYGSISPSGNSEVREKQKKTLMKHYGVENPSQSKEILDKMKQTFIEKYGVENPLLSPEIREKATQTILDRYGVDNVFLNKEIRNKRDTTLIERYGTLYSLQNEECFEKFKQTNLEKYGCEFHIQSEEIREKTKQTCLKKFGVENPILNEEIKNKIRQTNLERYGVEYLLSLSSFHEHSRAVDMERYGVHHHLQNPEILAKQKETFYKNNTCPTSKQQMYLHQLYGGELNYPLKMYNLDIYLSDERMNVEFDGSGHLMGVKRGNMTQEEFDRKEIIRNNTIKRENIKQMRIISSKDLLPSDQILLQMLSDTRNYFSQYPNHSWIQYNIDTSTVRNAEHKEGIPYDFGSLRTIKDSDINTIKDSDLNINSLNNDLNTTDNTVQAV